MQYEESRPTARQKFNQRTNYLATAVGIAFLSGCSGLGGPEYTRPELPEKQTWSVTEAGANVAEETIRPDWWASFGDSELDRLVAKAIAGSPDIRILTARIEEAGIGISEQRAGNIPTFSLGAGTGITNSPQGSQRSYDANASGLQWELDLWGRIRKGVDAKRADLRASEADYRAGYLSLVAGVATSYFAIRKIDAQIELQRRSIGKNKRILGIYQAQLNEGIVAGSKVLQQRAEARGLERNLLDQQRSRRIEENRLATLLGIPAGDFSVTPGSLVDRVKPVPVPVGLPSGLLSRRPDLIAAEYRVLSAHEKVGVAKLAKLPSVRLSGSGGLASTALSALLDGWTVGLAAALTIPIFDPKLDLAIDRSKVTAKISAEEYRKSVIKAFEEVESALTNLASRKQQQEVLGRELADLGAVNRQIQAQLRAGIVSQLEVFESERTLLSTQQTRLETYHQILTDTVTLYKALGGGWPSESVQLATR